MRNSRNISASSKRRVPLALSLLSAGETVEIAEDYDLLDINEMITKGREGFIAFVVTGDSMVPDIHPGYIVFVDSWSEPQNGDIVVSCVNDQINVKTFNRRSGGLFLIPSNGRYDSHRIRAEDDFKIIGVVRGHLALY